MNKINRIVELLHKFKSANLSLPERKELEEWLNRGNNREWAGKILTEEWEEKTLSEFKKYDPAKAYKRFEGKKSSFKIGGKWRWVAVFLLPVAIALTIWSKKESVTRPDQNNLAKQEIRVGENKAVLTLPDGKQICLGNKLPVYARNEETVFVEADSAGLVYNKKKDCLEELVYNELYVPRRGEYSIQLSDGTRVFLNADSRIRYPETFGRNLREVELTGEAYFEVKRDTVRPFIVKVGDMKVRVLGTVFNINAYGELPTVQTTLVSGKVNVECQGEQLQLLPGEQANLCKATTSFRKDKVNVALYTAWKDGLFKFERESLENIMRVLARWYDVKVIFLNTALQQSLFTGDLKKYDSIEEHLRMLELTTNISFVLEGNNVFVNYKK